MTTDLRDRRRRQTARDIQLAALRLATRHGYPGITTEAIATEAGISPRTFFNYYNNKQAAIVGEPPVLDAVESAWIVTSDAPLLDDLTRLMTKVFHKDRPERNLIQMIRQLSVNVPELSVVFRDSMDKIAVVLGGVLQQRLGPDMRLAAQLLADLTVRAFCAAVMEWAVDEDITEDQVPDLIRTQLTQVRDLLGSA